MAAGHQGSAPSYPAVCLAHRDSAFGAVTTLNFYTLGEARDWLTVQFDKLAGQKTVEDAAHDQNQDRLTLRLVELSLMIADVAVEHGVSRDDAHLIAAKAVRRVADKLDRHA